MRILLTIWAWVVLVTTVILGALVLAILFAFTAPFDRNRRLVGRAFRLSSVLATRLIPGWNFRAEGAPRRPERPTVVVSNHRSQADTFLLSELPWEMKWLGKEAAFKVPFLGWSMRMAGDVPVRRGTPDSARRAMAAMGRWLARGVPVMIFPEGTRSRDGRLLPFKDGAFRLAIEHGADILPVAHVGTCRAMPAGTWKLAPARARVRVGEPVPTAGLGPEDLPRLKAEVASRIEGLLAALAEAHPELAPADAREMGHTPTGASLPA